MHAPNAEEGAYGGSGGGGGGGGGGTVGAALPTAEGLHLDMGLAGTASIASATAQSLTTSSLLLGHRVLIVDDEPMNLTVAKRVARKLGASMIKAVRSGEEALEWIDSLASPAEFPSVLLLDFHMGSGLNGAETSRELRARGCRAPALIVTAGLSQADLALCRESFIVSVVYKPFNTDNLAHALLALHPSLLSPEETTAVTTAAVSAARNSSP